MFMETLMSHKSYAARWVRLPSWQPRLPSTPISAKMKWDISTLSTVWRRIIPSALPPSPSLWLSPPFSHFHYKIIWFLPHPLSLQRNFPCPPRSLHLILCDRGTKMTFPAPAKTSILFYLQHVDHKSTASYTILLANTKTFRNIVGLVFLSRVSTPLMVHDWRSKRW